MSDQRSKRRQERRARAGKNGPPGAGASRARPHQQENRPESAPLSTAQLWLIAAALAAVTFVLYLPVLHHPFIGFDDPGYVTENPRVKGGLTLDAVRWAMTSGYFANWHPLTWISHMVDVQLFGMNAGAHHATNLVLHVADTLLLYGILFRMTGAAARSALVATLFAVHPTHVESVAWVAERKDVLSTFFWMLTMWAYLAYTRKPGWQRYAFVLALFTLGLMSKPMLVTLPCVLLLLDVWPLRRATLDKASIRTWRRLVLEKVPLFALAAASSVITYVVQRDSGAVESLGRLPMSVRLANAVVAYWTYIEKLAWPSDLALLYPYTKTLWIGTVLLALAGLVAVSILVVRSARSRPYLLVGWLWFLGTLVPVIGIIQVGKQPMADRYTYVPSIGLFVIVVWASADILQRIRAPRAIGPAVSLCAVAILAVVARQQIDHWSSGPELWEHTIAVTRDNYLAENNLGFDLAREKRNVEAIPHYEAAIRMAPRFVGGHTNLALAWVAVGRDDQAVEQFKEALSIEPGNYVVHAHLGFALSRLGRLDEAISSFTEAIRGKNDYVEAHNGLGLALARKGDVNGAIREYNEALRYTPTFPEAHNNLGAALASQGKLDSAMTQFAEAIKLKPDYPDAHNNFGVALSTVGRLDEAIAQFREAVRLKPDHAKAHYGLGLALERQGHNAEAAREFTEVLRLAPGDPDARRALETLPQRGQ